jgi:hypothetical protein
MSQDLVFVWTRIVGYACRIVLCSLCVVISACSNDEGSTDPSTGVRRDTVDATQDTASAILRTPLMFCAKNFDSYGEVRDTFTITGRDFSATRPFKIWLVRVDGTARDTLRLFDNDSATTTFWFNQTMISTMRWIPKGRYRAEIVDAQTHRLLRSVHPELEVRSLQLRPLSKTTYYAGDRIKLTTVLPWGYTNVSGQPEYPRPRISAWIGDQQLKIAPSTREYTPGIDPLYDVDLFASVHGTGRIRLIDSSINEEALGPIITINALPYTKYFTRATLEWDRAVTWTEATIRRDGSPDTTVMERTLRDTIHAIIERGCCDTTTRGDTTKLTDAFSRNGRWQAIVVVDADRTLCRSILLTYNRSTSKRTPFSANGSCEAVRLTLVDVPITILADGSWVAELDAPTFASKVVDLTLSTSAYDEDGYGYGSAIQANGVILPANPMRFRLQLHSQ